MKSPLWAEHIKDRIYLRIYESNSSDFNNAMLEINNIMFLSHLLIDNTNVVIIVCKDQRENL